MMLVLCNPGSDMQKEFTKCISLTPIAIVYDDQPIAWACTHQWAGFQTLEIFTHQDHRREGLARAAASMLLAGGGMQTGQVVGSTNAKGEEPKERPLTPNDLWATVYRHLGIDWTQSFLDHSGRPMPILPFGEPISELLPVS